MMLGEDPLLRVTDVGLYCKQGAFYIDPWRPVERAVVTHAHSDHLCRGCSAYLVARDGMFVTRARLDDDATIETVSYAEPVDINGVRVSLHPAGHVLGSAQVRLERNGQVWVVSGDYKVHPDVSCQPFEPLACHVFISECTFGLPVYRWPEPDHVFREILQWWQANRLAGRASLLYAYALGKAQRLLAGLAATAGGEQHLPGPIFTHGAVEAMTRAYRVTGIPLPGTTHVAEADPGTVWSTALIVAPPSAHGTPWARRFGVASSGLASGWMRLRGTRRRRGVDRGFILSDHVDWPGLLATIEHTGADTVLLTHGYTEVVSRWLSEQGRKAYPVITGYEGERDEPAEPTAGTMNDTAGVTL
jgi:putative mRNA 3-end processing factor